MKRILSIALALMLTLLPCAFAEDITEGETITAVPIGVDMPTISGANPTMLTVEGSATVSMPADVALILLGVRETAADVQQAQSTVNEKIASIRAALVDMGIDNADITTDSLYIYANIDYNSGNERISSYTASNSLRITVRDIANTGAVIDAAFAAGANTLDNVAFHATDVTAASDQAYAEAVSNAMHKAKVIADATGMQCTAIVEIIEGDTDQWIDDGMKLRAGNFAATEDAAGTDIQESNVTVTANVKIIFELGAK